MGKIYRVKPLFDKTLYNEARQYNERFSILRLIVKYMEKNLDVMKPRYSEHMLPVPWPFVISRFHRDLQSDGWPGVLPLGLADGKCGIGLGLGNCPPTPPLT